jgi:ABC-type branched-subunit amino acid transport system ATPase component
MQRGFAVLEISRLTKRFGGLIAVNNLSAHVEKGTVLGLIGPNGAGKTTLVNTITGMLKPDSGSITYKGERIDGLPLHETIRKGIGRTFQITELFKNLTVMQNMLVPATWQLRRLRDPREKAEELLEFFEVKHLQGELAKNLSGGQQKLLDIAVVSMLEPELFLLDEPFFGIHPVLKKKILDKIKTMHEEMGKTFLIVSHDIATVMYVCEEVIVMSAGEVIASGTPNEIQNDNRVIEAYLGD